MPKTKTVRAATKRFKLTAAGKLLRRHAMRSHKLEKKTLGDFVFRDFSLEIEADTQSVKRLLGRR